MKGTAGQVSDSPILASRIVTSYTLGGFIHILLVVAVVVMLLRIIQGRNPIQG